MLLRCYDGDTCRFRAATGEVLKVRFRSIDTPEMKARCDAEKEKAVAARDALLPMLRRADRIDLENAQHKDRWGRTLALVKADGVDVGKALILLGLARPYSGGKRKGWC